jgi:hypothetical protein
MDALARYLGGELKSGGATAAAFPAVRIVT